MIVDDLGAVYFLICGRNISTLFTSYFIVTTLTKNMTQLLEGFYKAENNFFKYLQVPVVLHFTFENIFMLE